MKPFHTLSAEQSPLKFRLYADCSVAVDILKPACLSWIVEAMAGYLNRRFPERIGAIQALKAKDAALHEACDNYEEICSWLADRSPERGLSSKEYEVAREQVRELEDEILHLLEMHHDIT